MPSSNQKVKVLAIAIDSLEPWLVRRLLDEGKLPALARVAQSGKSSEVVSTAHIGSGSVWPSFMTGTPPHEHGVSNEWQWSPDEMAVERFSSKNLVPFWASLVAKGLSVGVFDVPFMPMVGIETGFEVNEWGAHDVLVGSTEVNPEAARKIVANVDPHPFGHRNISEEFVEPEPLRAMAEGAVEGIIRRGDLAEALIQARKPELAIIVFPEFHHLGHVLWHTVEAGHDLFAKAPALVPHRGPDLEKMLIAIDEQIARLSALVELNGSIVVFSLHGMKPSRGMPELVHSTLALSGLSQDPTWSSRTWPERSRAAFAALKRHAPDWAKKLYHRRVDQMVQIRLARSTMMKQYDWRRTRAFALPTDQHGLARVNVKGRERDGIVPPERYNEQCDEIEERVSELSDHARIPLVDRVIRPLKDAPSIHSSVPDVIVHWSDRAHDPGLELPADAPPVEKNNQHRTGQHTPHAFCIATGPAADGLGESIATEDLHKLILGALDAPTEN
jgi:predicted AlkP superfamily phosphohydrolase/phosphomutase